MSTQEMEETRSLALSSAVAALAAEAAAAAPGAGSITSITPCFPLRLPAAVTVAAADTARLIPDSNAGWISTTNTHTGGRRSSSPPTARLSATAGGSLTAADVLLSTRLQRKLDAEVHQACADGELDTCGGCSRLCRHKNTHRRTASSAYGTALVAGTLSASCGCTASSTCTSDGGSSNPHSRGFSSALRSSCPGMLSHAARQTSRKAADESPCSSCGSATARSHASHSSHCHGSAAKRPDGMCCCSCRVDCSCSSAAAACNANTPVPRSSAAAAAANRNAGQTERQQDDSSCTHTIDGCGAALQQCNSSSGSGSTALAAAAAAITAGQGYSASPCNSSPAHSAGSNVTSSQRNSPRNITRRSNKLSLATAQLASFCASQASSPGRQCAGGCRTLAAGKDSEHMQVQGVSATLATSDTSEFLVASSHPGSAAQCNHTCESHATITGRGECGQTEQQQQALLQHQQRTTHSAGTCSFSLTGACPGRQNSAVVVSNQAAAAVAAAVAAAEAMRATNSIELCSSRTATPRSSRLPHSPKASIVASTAHTVSKELPADAAGGACSSGGAAGGAGAAAAAAATARMRAASAAAVLQSVAGSLLAAVAPHNTSVSGGAASPGGLGSSSGGCSTSSTAGLPAMLMQPGQAAAAAASSGNVSTPRQACRSSPGSHTAAAAAKGAVRLFTAVDAAAWRAAEAAAGSTSWSLGVRLLQSPRPGRDGSQDAHAGKELPVKQVCAAHNSRHAASTLIN